MLGSVFEETELWLQESFMVVLCLTILRDSGMQYNSTLFKFSQTCPDLWGIHSSFFLSFLPSSESWYKSGSTPTPEESCHENNTFQTC